LRSVYFAPIKGPERISLRGFASAPRYPRLIPLPLDVEVLEYINPYTVYLRFFYSILIAFIVSYYLGISNYLLDRRRVAVNSYAKYVIFYILASLIVF
jgi:hypothetical protein